MVLIKDILQREQIYYVQTILLLEVLPLYVYVPTPIPSFCTLMLSINTTAWFQLIIIVSRYLVL